MVSRFADLKVAHKLLLGFGLVFFMLMSTLSVNILITLHQDIMTKHLVEQLYPSQMAITRVSALVRVIDDDGAWYVLESRPQQSALYLHRYYEEIVQLTTLLDQAEQLSQVPAQKRAIHNFYALYFGTHGYYEGNEAAFSLKKMGKMQDSYQAYVSIPFEPALQTTVPYHQFVDQTISQTVTQEHMDAQLLILLSIGMTLLALFLCLGLAWLMVRSITHPLKQVQQVMQRVSSEDIPILAQGLQALARGDLTYRVKIKSLSPTYESRDEIGQTASSIRMIMLNIHKTIAAYEEARQELQHLYQQLQTQNLALLQANERLQSLTETDLLTSLGNHRAYQIALHEAIEQAYNRGEVVMLALINLDEFKITNDEYGHLYGDQILSSLAHLLETEFSFATSFRLSGDTFAVLVPTNEQTNFPSHAEQLRSLVERQLGGATISIGVATSVIGEKQVEVVQEHAYAALHEAKKRGRNLVISFDAVRERVKLLSLHKIHMLRRLLSERQLSIAFQPIWDLAAGTLMAFEALARPHASYGFAGPAEAFELAEQLGRGYDLDELCILTVLQRAHELPTRALLFMNITPQTFTNERFDAEALKCWVLQAGLRTDQVVIEITERASIHLDQLLLAVQQLRLQGFLLALDDTGAGNAGLEMLHQVAVDFVKIDRLVMVNALTQRAARSVLHGICAIARESRSSVIIEGIEDKPMLDLGYQLGVQAAQGYLLGKPTEQIPSAETLANYNPHLIMGRRIAS